MKNTQKYLESLIKKSINETLETKANKLMDKIKEMEMEEGFDSPEIEMERDGYDYDKYEFTRKVRPYEFMKDLEMDSLTPDEFKYQMDTRDIDLEDELYGDDDDLDPFIEGDDDDIEPINEGEMCEQCGGGLSEGECMECGYRQMNEETYDLNLDNEFDYVQEEDEFDLEDLKDIEDEEDEISDDDVLYAYCKGDKKDPERCKAHMEMMKEEINEKLHGKQSKLDKNKNGKIDAEDFKLLRKSKGEMTEKWKGDVEVEKTGEYSDMSIEEINSAIKKLKKQNEKFQEDGKKVPQKNREKMSELYFAKRAKQGWKGKGKAAVEEGNEFSGELAKARKEGKKTFEVDGKTYPVKESIVYHIEDNEGDIIKLTENEIIDLIENLVKEQKTPGLKTIGKPKGLTTYEKAHKGSGDENKEYLKSVTKKMKDYLKDGSKGTYEMNPKMFPQGNGELAKMDKKAFKMTDELEDFNYEIAGQNFPVPDAIDYNEEWMEKLFKGDSMTGNAPGGNALESKTNDRFNKMRKKNTLKKLKDQSYKRVPQPVFNEKSGTDQGKGLNIKLESLEPKKTNQLNEEFDRIKQLLGYDRKTQ
jgi:hypothetical protein